MSRHFHRLSARLSLVWLWLVLAISGGASGMWFGRHGAGWVGNRVVWERPRYHQPDPVQVGDSLSDDGDHERDFVKGPWSEDDKRNGQLSSTSKYIFNLIRGKGRVSTTKRSAECEPGEFRCTEDGSCIPHQLVCNNQSDCPAGTDETKCSPYIYSSYDCPLAYSKCEAGYRQCYDDRYTCDGYRDCPNGSDELGCESSPCPAEGFIKCGNNWQCFDRTRTCDGIVDCLDGSDERNCENKECTALDQVKCGDGKQCYKEEYTCDGIIDCIDGSDERNCTSFQCGRGFKKCDNGLQCYKASFECDGTAHCMDSSDEMNCWLQVSNASQPLSVPEWQCNSRYRSCAGGNQCYLLVLGCDGVPACDDGSDEWQCATTPCPSSKVKCQDRSQCIWQAWLCDGEVHCKDGSEERGCSSYVPQFESKVGDVEVGERPDSTITATSRAPPLDPACSPSTLQNEHQGHAANHTASKRMGADGKLTGRYRI